MTFWKTQYWCRLTEILCLSASKFSFWLISLPGGSGLQKWHCQLRYVKFEYSCRRSVRLNNIVAWWKCSAPQLPKSHSGWDRFQGQEWSEKVSPFRFETLNLIKISDVPQNSTGNALPVRSQTIILVGVPLRQKRLAKSVTFQVRYVEFEEKWWRSAKLNIGLSWRKCSARQLPNLHSGWDFFQARAVCRSVSCQVRRVEFEDSCRRSAKLNIGVVGRNYSACQLPKSHSGWERFQGRERCEKVSPFRFDMLNLIKVSNVPRNLIFTFLDGIALLVSFQTLILVEIPSRRERCEKVSPFKFRNIEFH